MFPDMFYGKTTCFTFVTPIAPMFPPYVVVACPQPRNPATKLQKPSMAIPRFTLCEGGGGRLHIFAHA